MGKYKQALKEIIFKILRVLISLSCKINYPKLTSFFLLLSLRKSKLIKQSKNGKKNTQLEVQNRRYKVNEVIKKLEDSLQICRKHQAAYEWKTWMRQIDMQMSNPDKHRIICTDFGATLDLAAAEKDNCSVDNHAVLAIYFVLSNWRAVKYEKEEDKYDETIINDCNK